MKSFIKSALALSLLASSFTVFADDNISCPPLSAVAAAADKLDTVSGVLKKMHPDLPMPYLAASIEPFQYADRFWHLLSVADSEDMNSAIRSGVSTVRNAFMPLTDTAFVLGPIIMCGYMTPQDEPGLASVAVFSFQDEKMPQDLSFLPKVKSVMKGQKFSLTVK